MWARWATSAGGWSSSTLRLFPPSTSPSDFTPTGGETPPPLAPTCGEAPPPFPFFPFPFPPAPPPPPPPGPACRPPPPLIAGAAGRGGEGGASSRMRNGSEVCGEGGAPHPSAASGTQAAARSCSPSHRAPPLLHLHPLREGRANISHVRVSLERVARPDFSCLETREVKRARVLHLPAIRALPKHPPSSVR